MKIFIIYHFTHQSFLFAGQPEQHPNIVKERSVPNQNHIHATIPNMTVGTESHRTSGTTTREIGTIHHEEFSSDGHPSWDYVNDKYKTDDKKKEI